MVIGALLTLRGKTAPEMWSQFVNKMVKRVKILAR